MGAENFSVDGGADGEEQPGLPLLDRFGNPVRVRRRGRGRPAHEVSQASRDKVVIWLAQGFDEKEIAAALGISTRTLNKHYFHELGYRRSALMHLEAENMAAILAQVQAGKTSAMSLLDRKLQRAGQIATAKRHQVAEPEAPRAAAPPPRGLKAQRKAAAEAVTGRYAPPPPPRLIN